MLCTVRAWLIFSLLLAACNGDSKPSSPAGDGDDQDGQDDGSPDGDGDGDGDGDDGDGPDEPQAIHIARVRAEYRVNPLGIDVARPRLEWLLASDIQGQKQTAYQVLVARSEEALADDTGDLWDSGKVESDQSVHVAYGGEPLGSRERAYWKVRVWDRDGMPSRFSEVAFWEMGLLEASDWQAEWIASTDGSASVSAARWIWFPEGSPAVSAPGGSRFFRKKFTLPGEAVLSAYCDVSADNAFELFVNGTRVGDSSDWSDLSRFSVAGLLTPGDNVIAIRADNADGPAGLVGELKVALASGTTLTITSDTDWKASNDSPASIGAFQSLAFDDQGWPSAQDLGGFGMSPWGTPRPGTVPVYLRKEFAVRSGVKRARLYATALGLYELWLNGKRVGADHLTPGWTDYRKRLEVQTYDVTSLVRDGDNALGALLGDGWFRGKVGFLGRGDHFGTGPIRALVQLELEHDDGTRTVVATQASGAAAWKSAHGPILASDLMNGESHDARLELAGWSEPTFDDSSWSAVQAIDDGVERKLVASATDPVRIVDELTPVGVNEIRPGVFIFDLGQNLVGWERLRVSGSRGAKLTLRFAEVLNADGTLYTQNLRGARAIDTYVLRGGGEETFEPHFTTHGYRYAELSGDVAMLERAPDASMLTGIVAHSAMPAGGSFETNADLVNQLQHNILWGMRGNFVAVPTDCPQRDERLGWMGDAQIFAHTATLNMDVATFYTKWMRDVSDAQRADGAFTEVSPDPSWNASTPAWGDAGVIVPWTMYLAYGDVRMLEEHYDAMKRWMEHIRAGNPGGLWQSGRGSDYGDWLNVGAETDKELLATAFYAHSTDLVARAARVLGRSDDAAEYEALFATIKAAFATYLQGDGSLRSGTQTAYALALRFGLLSSDQAARAAELLAADVTARGHLSTGFVGVAHLLPALSMGGRSDLAYMLLTNESYPSWLYAIHRGATTIWERWDGIREDGSFQDPGMNSFNHYSFGAVDEWMFGVAGGIQLDEALPGYKHFFVRPLPGGGLDRARTTLPTSYGTIVSDWRIEGGVFTLVVEVPVNTTAHVTLPFGGDAVPVESGKHTFTQPTGG